MSIPCPGPQQPSPRTKERKSVFALPVRKAPQLQLHTLPAAPQLLIADFLECEEFGCLFVTSTVVKANLECRLELRKPFFYVYNHWVSRFCWKEAARERLIAIGILERRTKEEKLVVDYYTEEQCRHCFEAVQIIRELGVKKAISKQHSLAVYTFPWKYRTGVCTNNDNDCETVVCDVNKYLRAAMCAVDLAQPDHAHKLLNLKRFADHAENILRDDMRYFRHRHKRNRLSVSESKTLPSTMPNP